MRHGVIVIGKTGSGKSSILNSTSAAVGVETHTFSPKSLTNDEIYGSYDGQEWKDGVLTSLMRKINQHTEKQWIISDGPIDAVWIEHLNAVLDDNRKLHIAGEVIPFPKHANIIFEVEDLAVASPATVSRCGMVLVEPQQSTLTSIFNKWLKSLPQNIRNNQHVLNKLKELYQEMAQPAIDFVHKAGLEASATCASNLAQSLLRIIDSLIVGNEGRFEGLLDNLFQWAMVWSIGASLSQEGRAKFNCFLRGLATEKKTKVFPEEESVYDYELDLVQNKWVPWAKKLEGYEISPDTSIEEWVFPTIESTRTEFFVKTLLNNKYNVLTVGNSRSKAFNALLGSLNDGITFSSLRFSPRVDARNVQKFLEHPLEKVKCREYAPKDHKKHIYYVDDVNIAKKEVYGAVPSLEVLREFLEHGRWYDLSNNTRKSVKNVSFLCSMDANRGNKDAIPSRFKRHFNTFSFAPASDDTIVSVFSTAAASHFAKHNPLIQKFSRQLSESSCQMLSFAKQEFPAIEPNKHYAFNPSDIKKVFEGLVRAKPESVSSPK